MKNFKKVLLTLVALATSFSLVACMNSPKPTQKPTTTGSGQGTGSTTTEAAKELVYAENTQLNMGVVHNSNSTTITFKDSAIVGEGLTLADGKTYQVDDLKPVWAQLEKDLKVKFNNVYSGATSAANEYSYWKNLNFEGVDIIVGNASDIQPDGRAGKMVNLASWLDYMPNFKKFLEENPIVYLSLLADTESGAMYYAPYFDGYNDIEKYWIMRTDWVEALLDGENAFTADTTDLVNANFGQYTAYMPTTGRVEVVSLTADGTNTQTITKNYDTTYGNIVAYMNANVTSNTTGVELVNMLRGYIDACYGGYYGTQRSKLFTGYDACWDADELAALLRCVTTNTYALTGQNEKKVSGLFPRENTLQRFSDLLNMTQMFGVRGQESRNGYLYFDKDGNVCDARGDEAFGLAFEKMNQLYKEGLIMDGFKTSSTSKISEAMLKDNLGFAMYDYVQTQTIYNSDAIYPAYGLNTGDYAGTFTAVMTPVARWNDGTGEKCFRFTESWRSVKTNGWAIPTTCTGDKLQAALKLFDYVYSEEGSILMSYGPDAWRSGETITYKGQEIPELSQACKDELWTKAKGNYTNYARQYLGSTLPIGFVKDQGMEYQCTSDEGIAGAAKLSAAIALGTLKHCSVEINEENYWYSLVPTVLPTTSEDDTVIDGLAALQSNGLYSKEKGKYNVYIDVIVFGFGTKEALSNPSLTTMPATAKGLSDLFNTSTANGGFGGNSYKSIQQDAWEVLLDFYKTKLK